MTPRITLFDVLSDEIKVAIQEQLEADLPGANTKFTIDRLEIEESEIEIKGREGQLPAIEVSVTLSVATADLTDEDKEAIKKVQLELSPEQDADRLEHLFSEEQVGFTMGVALPLEVLREVKEGAVSPEAAPEAALGVEG